MLNRVFALLILLPCAYALLTGRWPALSAALIGGAGRAVKSALGMAGGMAFFCGLMEVWQETGLMDGLARRLRRPLTFLMGREMNDEAAGYAAMNLTANLLGMGNAATPMGVRAMNAMAAGERASNAMCRFLVLNVASVQLFPSTVVALRAAAGSPYPDRVALPILAVSAVTALTGMVCCRILERFT